MVSSPPPSLPPPIVHPPTPSSPPSSLVSNSFRFPNFLRHHVQAVLAHFWTIRLPLIQPSSPASLVARVLRIQLGTTLPEYTFVDFCAGAGGPTPAIERVLNRSTNQTEKSFWGGRSRDGKKEEEDDGDDGDGDGDDYRGVDFVLTDLHPHLSAWHTAARQSPHILFVPASVDASAVPPDLLSHAVRRRGRSSLHGPTSSSHDNNRNNSNGGATTKKPTKKQFRLFSLALHHFDDVQAARILRHALRTSSGFAVFELQARTFESMGIMALFGPLIWAGAWYWFWGQWSLLFWTYVVPVVPFVVVYDGVVSSLRTRTPAEIMRLIKGEGMGKGRVGGGGGGLGERRVGGGLGGEGGGRGEEKEEDDDEIDWQQWRFRNGSETHTWPLGEMNWFVGVKED